MPVLARHFAGETAPTPASAAKVSFSSLPTLLQAYIAVTTGAAGIILGLQATAIRPEAPELFYPVLITSVVLGLGLASMIELLRLANRVSDEKSVPVNEQPPTTPNYGAWRPRTAGSATMPTV